MTVSELFELMKSRAIEVCLRDGDALLCRAPEGAVDETTRRLLRDYREALIASLQGDQAMADAIAAAVTTFGPVEVISDDRPPKTRGGFRAQ